MIKDDITNFNFDLNQYYTYEYSHLLQPLAVIRSIKELSAVLKNTLSDNERRYSIVSKLSLQQRANKAASEGNIEVSLLKELLSEVRSNRTVESYRQRTSANKWLYAPKIETSEDLIKMLIGSTWRKKNDFEHIIFQSESIFYNNFVGHPKWRENNYYLEKYIHNMTLVWSIDGFKSNCQFQNNYTEFIELSDPDEKIWYLVSLEPLTPLSGF